MWRATCNGVHCVRVSAMNAIAIQTEIQPMPPTGSAGQTPNGSSTSAGTSAFGGTTFSDQLNHAMNSGGSSGSQDSPSSKATVDSSPNATPYSPATHHAAAPAKGDAVGHVSGAPQSPSPVATNPVSTSSQSDPAAGAAATKVPTQSQPGGTVSSRLLWLTEMIPFAAALQQGSAALDGAGKGASTAAQATAHAAAGTEPQGKTEVDKVPAGIEAINHLAVAGDKASGAPGANAATPDPGSAQTTPGPQTAPSDAQMQSVLRSLESVGLSSASTSAAANATTLPSSSSKISTPPVTAATNSPAHAPQPKIGADTAAQSAARDVNATTAAAGSSGAGHADSSSTVKAAGSSDGAKSGNGQDPQQGKPSSPQPGAGTNGGSASAAATANQAAAGSFGATLNQAGQPGATQAGQPATAAPGSTTASGQPGAPLPTVAEKVATAMQSPVNAPGGVVSAASLVENQGKTEMRVSLQTDTMGALQLHAVLDNGRVGASISVVNHEAHTLLTNELPSLQQALADQNVRLDHLTVINTPMTSGGMGDSRGFQSADYNQQRNQNNMLYSGSLGGAQTSAVMGSQTTVQEEIRRRLSVRA